jgi:hypothetical protein
MTNMRASDLALVPSTHSASFCLSHSSSRWRGCSYARHKEDNCFDTLTVLGMGRSNHNYINPVDYPDPEWVVLCAASKCMVNHIILHSTYESCSVFSDLIFDQSWWNHVPDPLRSTTNEFGK